MAPAVCISNGPSCAEPSQAPSPTSLAERSVWVTLSPELNARRRARPNALQRRPAVEQSQHFRRHQRLESHQPALNCDPDRSATTLRSFQVPLYDCFNGRLGCAKATSAARAAVTLGQSGRSYEEPLQMLLNFQMLIDKLYDIPNQMVPPERVLTEQPRMMFSVKH